MKIALGYDGTYTRDEHLWNEFVSLARSRGHKVVVVTFRPECCPVIPFNLNVIYTNGAKKRLCFDADVWIDDQPELI